MNIHNIIMISCLLFIHFLFQSMLCAGNNCAFGSVIQSCSLFHYLFLVTEGVLLVCSMSSVASWKSWVRTVWPNNQRKCLMYWKNLVKGKLFFFHEQSPTPFRLCAIKILYAPPNMYFFCCVMLWLVETVCLFYGAPCVYLDVCVVCVFSSYGSVFKAIHKESGQVVAIKQVPVESDLQEIIKEISIMQQCDR